MELRERIKEMLGQGLPTTVVASAVGCTPSYVSQLLEEEDFKEAVVIQRSVKVEAQVKRDNKWDAIEDAALAKIERIMPMVTRASDLVKIASVANAAKRRTAEAAGLQDTSAPTVVLNLPKTASVQIQVNRESQVITVDGRSMQALPTKHLAKLVERVDDAEEVRTIEQPAAQVPTFALAERKKVLSILEQIGYADEAVPVPNVLNGGST